MKSRPVVIIGAGPAGMAAAIRLGRHAASNVILLDEQPAPGGQIYRAIERNVARNAVARLGADYAHGAALVSAFRTSGVDYRPASAVWQVSPGGEVLFSRDGQGHRLDASVVICATGAQERPVPLPGWTLPGVMTAGALQTLLKASGVVPEGRAILIGSGPLLLLLASQLIAAGASPAAVLDTSPRISPRRVLPYLGVVTRAVSRGYLAKGLGMKRRLRASGIPVYRGVADIRIEGRHGVEEILFLDREGGRRRLDASLVALHEGVLPNTAMTRSLRCQHAWSEAQAAFRPVLDMWGGTSIDRILVAGDCGGIGGAIAAEASGEIAALRTLEITGRIDAASRDREASSIRDRLRDHLAIRPLLDALYPPPAWIAAPSDEVLICRCEEVTAGQLREVIDLGCPGPNQAKSFLRCGMGPCQGRFCGATVSAIFAAATGRSMDEVGAYGIRPPIKPVTVGEIAGIEADAS